MPPRLIAIDIDGTLLNSSGHISERNLAALSLAEDRGIEITIATGRRHCYAMRVLHDLNRPPSSVLASSNGAVIRSIDSTLVHRTHMPLSTARWLCEHIRDFHNTLVLTFDKVRPDGEEDNGVLVCEDIDALNATLGLSMDTSYIAQVSPIEQALNDNPPIQMMLCGSIDRMRAATARLLQDPRVRSLEIQAARVATVETAASPGVEVDLHCTEYPARDLCILDILPAGCSKASAVLHLARLRNIDPADILAIGDNWNDVPMFRVAGHSVVMANAPADLKALAAKEGWSLTATNDEDGVAQAIEAALA